MGEAISKWKVAWQSHERKLFVEGKSENFEGIQRVNFNSITQWVDLLVMGRQLDGGSRQQNLNLPNSTLLQETKPPQSVKQWNIVSLISSSTRLFLTWHTPN